MPLRILQITPGAGGMYCGNCIRDNALVGELRRRGVDATLLPLYLPLTLDSSDQSAGKPIFFGGIYVYLEQKLPFLARGPKFLRNLFAAAPLLKLAAKRAGTTKASELGDLTLSIAKGEEGRQAADLELLLEYIQAQPEKPDVIILSNVMLAGLARRLSEVAPILCTLQGEDLFLDALSPEYRQIVWDELARRGEHIRLFIAPSKYFGSFMQGRLKIPDAKLAVLHNGIDLTGMAPAARKPATPTIGFFARICKEKGAPDAVDAFIRLAKSNRVPHVRLKMGGSLGAGDEPMLKEQRRKIAEAGLSERFELHPNLSREEKIRFLQDCTIFSAPALYGEGFGLYLLEAWACGLPVVQPRHAAFPELVEATGGGLLVEPGDTDALASAWGDLLTNPERATELGRRGHDAVHARFTIKSMADNFLEMLAREGIARP